MKNINILSALAFGDFVIDYHFLIESNLDGIIFCPNYLKPLADAMDALKHTNFFCGNFLNIPPSIFGIKSSNFRSILSDCINLREAIKKINGDMIIPHNNLRWRAILYPRTYRSICDNNIYYSYRKFYNLEKVKRIDINTSSKIVYIFPESRQISKNVPSELCLQMANLIEKNGLICKQVVMKNSIYKNNSKIDTIYIDKLSELIDIIDSSRFIISADSLPVHLAYWKKRSSFILSPKINYKMFPDIVIEDESWSLFNDGIRKFDYWFKSTDVEQKF